MADLVKVLVYERNNTEVDFPTELLLLGSNIPASSPDNPAFVATDIAGILEELRSVRPSIFMFERSGLTIGGTYFENGLGIILPFNGRISEISISSSATVAAGTATIQVHRRTAVGTYAPIAGAAVNLTATNYRATATGLNIAVAKGSELCVYLTGTSLTNMVATLTIYPQ